MADAEWRMTDKAGGPPHRRRVEPYVLPFLTSKKEQLVFFNGAVKVPAEIVKAEFPSHRRKKGARIKLVIAEKIENAAMIIIAASSSDDVNRSAGVTPVFG